MERIRVFNTVEELYEWLDKYNRYKDKDTIEDFKIDPAEQLLILLRNLGMMKYALDTWYTINYDDLED